MPLNLRSGRREPVDGELALHLKDGAVIAAPPRRPHGRRYVLRATRRQHFRHVLESVFAMAQHFPCTHHRMESITLSQYLEKTSNPKRAAKLVKRSVKLFRHAAKDLAHAECDLAHAKEDCLHTIEAYENCLEDTKQYVADWTKAGSEVEATIVSEDSHRDEDIFSDDQDEEDEEGDSRLGDHLENAAADFKHAMKDATDALENLEEIDGYVEELLDDAEDEGFELSLAEVRSEIVRRVTELEQPEEAAPAAKLAA